MQCCWRSFLKMESFSFIQELTVLFEVRFKIFSEKKKKSRKLQKLLWLLQKSVIPLNLEYLVRSMAPENHKNHKLICLLIFTLCWQIVKEKKCILSSPWMYHVWTFIFRMKIFQLPSTSRNQSQTQALEKTGRSVIGPLWKNITYTSFGFKTFTKIGIFIAHTISLALSKK